MAVCKKDIPLGTRLYIDGEGYGFRIAEDTGVGSGCIDVYVSDHQRALDLGVKYLDVYIVKEGNR